MKITLCSIVTWLEVKYYFMFHCYLTWSDVLLYVPVLIDLKRSHLMIQLFDADWVIVVVGKSCYLNLDIMNSKCAY